MAYSQVGHQCLAALLENNENIVAVITHENNPNETLWFDSVEQLALDNKVPVFKPDDVNAPAFIEQLRALEPDIIFSFYYREIITQEILDLPALGAFNMHGSLLPRYRGCAPVNWSIIHGEKEIGATLHHMVKKLDAGNIVGQKAVTIEAQDTALMVGEKVADAAVEVLVEHLSAIKAGNAPSIPQDNSKSSYFGRRGPKDGAVNWQQPASCIFDFLRALTHPYPGAFTMLPTGQKVLLWWGKTTSGEGKPGQVLNLEPLTIATTQDALVVTTWEWAEKNLNGQTLSDVIKIGDIIE